MAGNASFAQYCRIDSDAVIAEADPEIEDAEMNFNLNSAGIGVAICIEKCLTAGLFELLLHKNIKVAAPSAHRGLELRRAQSAKLSSHRCVGLGQCFRLCPLGPEARKHTPSLDQYAIRMAQSFFE